MNLALSKSTRAEQSKIDGDDGAALARVDVAARASIPTPEEVWPELKLRVAASYELQHRIATLDKEIDELRTEIGHSHRLQKAKDEAAISALLGEAATVSGAFVAAQDRLPIATEERRIARLALERVKRAIGDDRNAASRIVCDLVRDDYARLVREICESILALRERQLAYHAMVDELEAKGVMWTALNPMPPRFLGHPTDEHGNAARYLREAAESGFIPRSMIPDRLRFGAPPEPQPGSKVRETVQAARSPRVSAGALAESDDRW